MLLFKKKYLEKIRSGQKKQTIRFWKYRRMKAGQRSYIPGIGYIQITGVELVELEKLTEHDARLDGFSTRQEFIDEIHQLYADKIDAGYQTYRITFSLLPSETTNTKKVS